MAVCKVERQAVRKTKNEVGKPNLVLIAYQLIVRFGGLVIHAAHAAVSTWSRGWLFFLRNFSDEAFRG
jgi:hypothetical protein